MRIQVRITCAFDDPEKSVRRFVDRPGFEFERKFSFGRGLAPGMVHLGSGISSYSLNVTLQNVVPHASFSARTPAVPLPYFAASQARHPSSDIEEKSMSEPSCPSSLSICQSVTPARPA